MGTNYYLIKDEDKIHIGKSSYGWRFLAEFDDKTEEEWWEFIKSKLKDKYKIFDEYGRKVSFRRFRKIVLSKKEFKKHDSEYEEYRIIHDKNIDIINVNFC